MTPRKSAVLTVLSTITIGTATTSVLVQPIRDYLYQIGAGHRSSTIEMPMLALGSAHPFANRLKSKAQPLVLIYNGSCSCTLDSPKRLVVPAVAAKLVVVGNPLVVTGAPAVTMITSPSGDLSRFCNGSWYPRAFVFDRQGKLVGLQSRTQSVQSFLGEQQARGRLK